MKHIFIFFVVVIIPVYTMEKKHYTITNKDANSVLVTTANGKQITLSKLTGKPSKQNVKKEQTFEEFVEDQLRQIFFCCFRKRKQA